MPSFEGNWVSLMGFSLTSGAGIDGNFGPNDQIDFKSLWELNVYFHFSEFAKAYIKLSIKNVHLSLNFYEMNIIWQDL